MEAALPELAGVPWRRRVDADSLRARGRLWTATTVAHVVPLVAVAAIMVAFEPLAAPVSAIALAMAWIIPALYAQRGGNVVRATPHAGEPGLPRADRVAHLLLALREDEAGFATVANLAFSGAPWRLRPRMPRQTRPALAAARARARLDRL